MGEKFDGFRACWNPLTDALYSRFKNEFFLPDEITDRMPHSFLDGELWVGRGNYSRISKMHTNDSTTPTTHPTPPLTTSTTPPSLRYVYARPPKRKKRKREG